MLKELSLLDSAAISDALDSLGIEGALSGIKPLTAGAKLVGPAFTVKYLPYEQQPTAFKGAGNYIDDVPAGSVIVIDNNASCDCTTWGDILTTVALQKQIQGTVVNGAVRDVSFIREHKYPVFSCHTYMRSGKNRVYKSSQDCKLVVSGIAIHPGDIVFADDNGVLIIPKNRLQEVITRAQTVMATEESILTSVAKGMSLKHARNMHGYHQPWAGKGA